MVAIAAGAPCFFFSGERSCFFGAMDNFVRHNALVYAGNDLAVTEDGIKTVHFPLHQLLLTSVVQGFMEARTAGSQDGLLLSHSGKSKVFVGYDQYFKVHGQHTPHEQRKMTTLIQHADIAYAERGLKGLQNLIDICQPHIGESYLFQTHILQQSSPQALFSWHRDTEEFDMIQRTVICLLSPNTTTSMQIAGRHVYHYTSPGQCAIFPSDAIHRSCHASPGTIKIALFFAQRRVQRPISDTTLLCFCGQNLMDGAQLQCSMCFRWCHINCSGLTIAEAECKAYTCAICDNLELPCT